jgi:hypothetical protein
VRAPISSARLMSPTNMRVCKTWSIHAPARASARAR